MQTTLRTAFLVRHRSSGPHMSCHKCSVYHVQGMHCKFKQPPFEGLSCPAAAQQALGRGHFCGLTMIPETQRPRLLKIGSRVDFRQQGMPCTAVKL